jgi:hypothetical protein
MPKMSDDQLRAVTDGEMRQAVGYWSGKLANQRLKAMAYYLGEAKLDLSPPEVEGRSTVVSPDVRNTIESMLPQLMVKFCGGDSVVEFEPNKPGDEAKAAQATDYCNHCFFARNNGERVAYNWMKDALLSKNGIIKVWWDTRSEETREEYMGMSDIELAQLMDDDEIEVTEQKSYPDEDDAEQRQEAIQQLNQQLQQAAMAAQQGNPQAQQAVMQLQQQLAQIDQQPPKMLFDVTCKRVIPGGKIKVENVPPEEFLISRKAKTIADAGFVGHRVVRSASELTAMGYKNVDQLTSDDSSASLNMERIERLAYDDELAYLNTDTVSTLDPSQRLIWVTECYVRVDFDGDGIAELRKVVRAGNQILDNEIVDVCPFVDITPVPMPHKFFGLSVADLALEAQRIKTSILRAQLDNLYLSVNGRTFAVDGQVNMDDLLTSRPGGVVRIKQPGAVGMLDQGRGDGGAAMGMMEYMQGYLEDSTGWTRYNQGSDGDSLNQTATGVNQITNRADMRLDLIARNFAEGFRNLFRLMLRLCSQYQSKEEMVKLRGEWVSVNPRDWRTGFDTTVNVGLGTGSKDQQVQHLMMLAQQQQFGLQIGTATPQNVFEAQKELAKALGFKSGDKFFSDPAKNQAPQQPNPVQLQMQLEQAKAQAQMQIEQAKIQAQAQIEQMKAQINLQLEQTKAQAQQQVDITRQSAEAEQQDRKVQAEAQLALAQAQLKNELERERLELERWKAQLASNTQIYLEQVKQGMAASDAVELAAPDQLPSQELRQQVLISNDAIAQTLEALRTSIDAMRAPRQIVRDANGRAQGIM